MSSLIVEVTTIKEVLPHLGADLLEIVTIEGKEWQNVVRKSDGYFVGEKVVFVPPDAMIPLDLAERWNVKQHLGIKSNATSGRLRFAKIRGVPSFGTVQKVDDESWEIGLDVAEYYGITKYEPPVTRTEGDALPDHPLFVKYTDIQNLRNFPDIFEPTEHVVITEKIHGQNVRVGIIDGERMAGSHNLRRTQPEAGKFSPYWFPFSLPGVEKLLTELGKHTYQIILFGEVFGKGIQTMSYGYNNGIGFRVFDMMVGGKYVDHDFLVKTCNFYKVDMVPVLEQDLFSFDRVVELSKGNTTIGGDHIREGVVVKAYEERGTDNPKVDRAILKYINDDYLFSKHSDREIADV